MEELLGIVFASYELLFWVVVLILLAVFFPLVGIPLLVITILYVVTEAFKDYQTERETRKHCNWDNRPDSWNT